MPGYYWKKEQKEQEEEEKTVVVPIELLRTFLRVCLPLTMKIPTVTTVVHQAAATTG